MPAVAGMTKEPHKPLMLPEGNLKMEGIGQAPGGDFPGSSRNEVCDLKSDCPKDGGVQRR